MSSAICLRHRQVAAAASCHRCDEGMCDACWVFRLDVRPVCARCVHDFESKSQQRVWRLLVFSLILCGLAFWVSRHLPLGSTIGVLISLSASIGVAVYLTSKDVANAQHTLKAVVARQPGAPQGDAPFVPAAHPYRARLARVITPQAPSAVSAKVTALVVGASLLLSAVVLPVSLKLPRWIEFEVVLFAWWSILFGTLAVLLYKGTVLRDDYAFSARWGLSSPNENAVGDSTAFTSSSNASGNSSWLDVDTGCAEVEGCGGMLAGLIFAALAFAATWILLEVAFPVLLFLAYWLLVGAIGRVVNDKHACESNLARATFWGALWATVYTFPVALVVWGIHTFVLKHHGQPL
jgi:uncharacterized protein (DUF983 family)